MPGQVVECSVPCLRGGIRLVRDKAGGADGMEFWGCVRMNTLLNYPGAKWGMAAEIVSLMPPHRSYLEPFFGSGAVQQAALGH